MTLECASVGDMSETCSISLPGLLRDFIMSSTRCTRTVHGLFVVVVGQGPVCPACTKVSVICILVFSQWGAVYI